MTTPPSRKRKAADSKAGSECSSRRQATTSCRITRSRFKTINENNSVPNSLNPGLEMKPRRRRALAGGQRATAVATGPQDAVSEAPTAPEQLENKPVPRSQTEKRVFEADVAAAFQLAQAVLKAGLAAEIPTGIVDVSEISQGNESLTEQGPTHSTAEVVDDAEATQDCTPPTEPKSPSPLQPTSSPSTHGVNGELGNYHCGTDSDELFPGTVVGCSPYQARPEPVQSEPKAEHEWPEVKESAGAVTDAEVDSQGNTNRQQPTPWLPDKADNFRPQWEWSASEQTKSQTKAPAAGEDKPTAISSSSLIRSGGIGGEIESPIQNLNSGGSNATPPWQPEANKVMYAADVAQIVSSGEDQAVIGPLPPAALQWEPAPYSVAGCNYSPEVFPADFEDSEPEVFELEEWDDDVDP